MNFAPDNRATLDSLLTALHNGLSGSQALPIYKSVLQNQAQRVADRKAQTQQYVQDLIGMAQGGYPRQQAVTMMDLLTPNKPGVPPQVQNALATVYPRGERITRYNAAHPEGIERWSGPRYSPLFTGNPQIQYQQQMQNIDLMLEQARLNQAMTPQADPEDYLSVVAQAIQQGSQLGWSAEDIRRNIGGDVSPMTDAGGFSMADLFYANFPALVKIFPQLGQMMPGA